MRAKAGSLPAYLDEMFAKIDSGISDWPDECVIWPFSRGSTGRGQIWIKGITFDVHKLICEHAHGQCPPDKQVAAHSCGRGKDACISPNHLSWKTYEENEADRVLHGTVSRGAKNFMSKLTEDNAKEILQRAPTENHAKLAQEFGVSPAAVWSIVKKKSWAWVESIP